MRHSAEPRRARRLSARAVWLVLFAFALQPLNSQAAEPGGLADDRADSGDARLGAGTHFYKQVGEWVVASDDTLGGGCFILREYDQKVALRVGIDARNTPIHAYMMLGGAGLESIETRREYPVELTFGRAPPRKLTASGFEKGGHKVLSATFDSGAILDGFSDGPDVKVSYLGNELVRLDLDGSSAVLDAMVLCEPERPPPPKAASDR